MIERIPKVSLDEFQIEDTISWTYFISRASIRKEFRDNEKPNGKIEVGAKSLKAVLKAEEKGDSITKIVYTTWHNGSVKGINFPSKGLCEYTKAVAEKTKVTRCDRLVSIHPVYHVAEQLVALQLPVVTGCSITYYTPSKYTRMNDLVDFLHAAHPTVFGTTPRQWERLCFYAIYAWMKSAGKRKMILAKLVEKGRNCDIEDEFLPVDPKDKRKLRTREQKEKLRKLLGLKDVHFAYSYRSPRPQVEQFFAMRELQVVTIDGFPEAGGVCSFRAKAGAEEEPLLPEIKPPRWRETKMLLTRRGDYVPKKYVESLFSGYEGDGSVVERVELVSSPWQSIGAVIYVNEKAASDLLAVPKNRLWRSRDLSEYLRDIVNEVNQRLQYDQRISRFTQRISSSNDDVPLDKIVVQIYKEDNLI